ncbi:glycosyltransferase family 1 protein [Cellulomonas sp.]|uniref:glycosyltransferase family 4 protein n=1 Tax=Cellulomonas sp. TaxID=40001 RepID=UPI001B2A4D68|nr:glycosyltransferase family 1 protein [Cellulomonas sp.]MBO9555484.1 glycosyltransferase family 4 protein [Cellulomonas sp.]
MKILIDATAIPEDRGGVGRYVDALLPALVAEGADLVVACQARDTEVVSGLVPSAEVVPAPTRAAGRPARLLWEQTGLVSLVRSTGAQVLHSPHYTMPRFSPVPVVVTLHDATFFSHPEVHSPVKARFFRSATRTAVRRAAALVVPSRATRDEVVRYTHASPDAFHVAYHGVDRALFHPVDEAEQERVRQTLDLHGRPYVAFLGTLEPRKNVPALVRGWVDAVRDLPEPPALLLAGAPGWDEEVDPEIARVPEGLVVRRTGYLPLADLAGYLSGALVVAYPTLGEGFGLPVLEAMSCGAAVLTTRELSMPEVGGDAVDYCGTDDASISVALRTLLTEPEHRAQLAAEATARAGEFTWRSAARTHLAAYEAALSVA